MLIPVVAFNSKDSLQAARMLHWCADLCGQQPNTIILAYEPGVPAEAVLRAASRAFATVEHLPVRSSWDAWPGSANDYFGITAQEMRKRGLWLWLEPDCVFTRPTTLAELENDFQRCGKGAIGAIIPAWFEKDGRYEKIGEMLAGVAVYHPGLWDKCPVLRSLRGYNTMHAKAKVPPMAFDCRSRHEFLKISIATPLIQHMGRSREFRREGGQIVCSYTGSLWSPVLAPETALAHGCKDSSLIDLLRAEMNLPERAEAGGAAPSVRVIETARKPAAPTIWGTSDAPPPEKATNGVHGLGATSLPMNGVTNKPVLKVDPRLENLPIRLPASREAETELTRAREAIRHWPECASHVFTLNEGRNKRFRVLCQCGAMSEKLSEGVDWPAAWEAMSPIDNATSGTEESQPQGEVASVEPHKLNPVGSIPTPATLSVLQVHISANGGTVIFSDGSSQSLTKEQIVKTRARPAGINRRLESTLDRIAPRFPKKAKPKRTAAEQAKINARMAEMRAKKKPPVPLPSQA